MNVAATFLGGAHSRLLPASIPFRFFASAGIFHVLIWLVLIVEPGEGTSFRGGMGPPLAALHLLTLGVLTTTVIGASIQLLPVATRRALPAIWPIKLVFWLFMPGLVVLVIGMYARHVALIIVGAAAVTTALAIFAALLAINLRWPKGFHVVAAYGWAALVSLVVLTALGLALALDYQIGTLPDHGAAALAHLILGGFGFMGLLALGFSHILMPMFALAAAPDERTSFVGFALAALAIVLGVAGAFADSRATLTSAALVGLTAAAIHLWLMAQVLRDGMRKRLGLSFWLVRAAWVMLPATLLVGLAALYQPGHNVPTLFGFLLLGGWLLTFLLGMLQRIVPFLASMHTGPASGARPMLLSEMAAAWPLKLHAVCHGVALTGIGIAIALNDATLLRTASGIGLVGALAIGWFIADVMQRVFRPAVS